MEIRFTSSGSTEAAQSPAPAKTEPFEVSSALTRFPDFSQWPGPSAARVGWTDPGKRPAFKPLRIVRVLDSDYGHNNAGRMVISGRLADVCAELERLATLETSMH